MTADTPTPDLVIGTTLDEQYCEVAAQRMGQGVLEFGDAS